MEIHAEMEPKLQKALDKLKTMSWG
jgi:hypothetical protein